MLHKNEYRSGEEVTMALVNGKLLVRSEEMKPKPFVIVNPDTLEESKEEIVLEKGEKNCE